MQRRYYTHFLNDKETAEEPRFECCAWQDCGEEAAYPAPKSKEALEEYQWFCRHHIQEFNKQWNFFEHMPDAEALQFQYEAEFGHRPTWKMGVDAPFGFEQIEEALKGFWAGAAATHQSARSKKAESFRVLPEPIREALALFQLDHDVTHDEIKKQYKILVKKYHPDLNHQQKECEEMFKKISIAYRVLMDYSF